MDTFKHGYSEGNAQSATIVKLLNPWLRRGNTCVVGGVYIDGNPQISETLGHQGLNFTPRQPTNARRDRRNSEATNVLFFNKVPETL